MSKPDKRPVHVAEIKKTYKRLKVFRRAVFDQTFLSEVLDNLRASSMIIAKRPDTEFLRVNHRPFRVYEPVAKIFETTPVSGCRRLPSCLQKVSYSEIFRLRFDRLCPNAKEVLLPSDLLAPLPVWVRKKREILVGLLWLLSCLSHV